jgi:hypothetical protein
VLACLVLVLFIGILIALYRYFRSLKLVCPVLACLRKEELEAVLTSRGGLPLPHPTIIREKKRNRKVGISLIPSLILILILPLIFICFADCRI